MSSEDTVTREFLIMDIDKSWEDDRSKIIELGRTTNTCSEIRTVLRQRGMLIDMMMGVVFALDYSCTPIILPLISSLVFGWQFVSVMLVTVC